MDNVEKGACLGELVRTSPGREMLPVFNSYLAAFLAEAERMARIPFSVGEFSRLVRGLFDRRDIDEVLDEALGLFADEPRTRWGAYCAIIQWMDEFQPVRGRVGTRDELRAMRMLSPGRAREKADVVKALLR